MISYRAPRHWRGLFCALVAVVTLGAWPVGQVQAQSGKPMRIISPFSPGSGVDAIARIYAQKLSEQMNVPVVVENKEGAGGMIGAAYAARLPADGTSMLVATTPFVVGPVTQGNAGYDPVKDFIGIGRIATNPLALVVNPTVPAKSMKELIAYATANPGKLTYASSGPGTPSQLEMEALKEKLKVDIREIPYRSNAQALTDVIGGVVSMYYTVQSTSLGNVAAGQLRPLAVAASKSTQALPGVPTVADAAALPGYEAQVWYGFVVPAGTPREVVDRLNAELAQAAKSKEVQEGVRKLGFELSPSSPEDFTLQIAKEGERWAPRKGTASSR